MDRNVGGTDRILRGILAIVFGMTAVAAFATGRRTGGLLASVVAIGFALNYAICFCSVNKLLGIDTTES